jgi:hypothetical protein
LTSPSWIDPIATLRQHQRPLQLCFQVCVNLPAHTHTPLSNGFLFYDFPLSNFVLWTQAKGNVSMGGETVVVLFGAQLLVLASKSMTFTIDLLTKKKKFA